MQYENAFRPPSPAQAAVAYEKRLQPRSIGGIMDEAIELFRINFWRFFFLVLAVYGAVYLLQHGFIFFGINPNDVSGSMELPVGMLQIIIMLIYLPFFIVIAFALYNLAYAFIILISYKHVVGEPLEFKEGMRIAVKKIFPLMLGTLILGFYIFLGFLPFIFVVILLGFLFAFNPILGAIAAILLVFPALIPPIIIFLRYVLYPQCVIVENLTITKALKRSRELMSAKVIPGFWNSNAMRISVVFIVILALQIALRGTIYFLAMLIFLLIGYDFSSGEFLQTIPDSMVIFLNLIEIVANSIVFPFGQIALLLFYFDLRVRKEGFDLEMLVTEIEKSKAAPVASVGRL